MTSTEQLRARLLVALCFWMVTALSACASDPSGPTSASSDPSLSVWETNIHTGLTGKRGIGQVELYVITVRSENSGDVLYDFKSKSGLSRFRQIAFNRTQQFPPGTYSIETRCLPGPADISAAAEARALDTISLRVFLERDIFVQLVPGTNGILGCYLDVRGTNRRTGRPAHVIYELR